MSWNRKGISHLDLSERLCWSGPRWRLPRRFGPPFIAHKPAILNEYALYQRGFLR